MATKITYKTLKLKNGSVRLPTSVYSELKEQNICISANKQGFVELRNSDSTYAGTLKNVMGIKSFKDGNPFNFTKSNLVMA